MIFVTPRDECDCCEYPAERLKEYAKQPVHLGGTKRLCELCASTLAGTAADYPRQFSPDTVAILKAISYVGNAIIDAVKERK